MSTAATASKDLTFIKFKSSNVAEATFDPARKVIIVRFHNGGQGEYSDCDFGLWKEMNAAESVGKFLATQLKGVKEYTGLGDWK